MRACPGGDLLDVGCGPGMQVRQLLDTRGGDFRITACDRSPAMMHAVAHRVGESAKTRLAVASIEDLPFQDKAFVLGMGVLEYVDARRALREITRVVRDDGLVVVTMLNPLSPYRIVDWIAYRPALRMLGRVEGLLGVPEGRRHAAAKSGVRALPVSRLRHLMRRGGLRPESLVYYDVTPLLPPVRPGAQAMGHTVAQASRDDGGEGYPRPIRNRLPRHGPTSRLRSADPTDPLLGPSPPSVPPASEERRGCERRPSPSGCYGIPGVME
ncbi:class I SAM-dependent methyltransferase [Kribbella sp. NPDC023972]|uniref:class I SAM-dependent methyltransferase n=1 Tax=Kribbella sp. NPDC023972 TaxID=3154795 RepID=UPI0033F085F6